MQTAFVFPHAIPMMALACSLSAGMARADGLPWLSAAAGDPFASEERAAKLVSPDLKPSTCGSLPETGKTLTLNDIVIAALCHNPQTRAAYLNLVGQATAYVGNYSAYLPTVSASYSHGTQTLSSPGGRVRTISTSTGLTLGLTLYDFGQREFRLETAELALATAGHAYNATLQGTIAGALQGYYALLTAKHAVAVAKESEHFAKASYDAASLRHRIGQVPLADELQAKGAYSQALLATERAENGLSLQRAAMALLMGMEPADGIEAAELDENSLAADPFPSEIPALIAEAKSRRHDLLAGRAGLKGAEASYEALKRANLATVSVTAGLGVTNDTVHLFNRNATRSQAIGLSVSVPIFTGFSQTYSERAAEKALAAQRESLAATELAVVQDVWDSWHNYQTAKHSWRTSQDQLATAEHLKDVALGRYRHGLGTILDVLSAQGQYDSALQSALQSRYNVLTTRVDLVRSVGSLTLDTMRPDRTVSVPGHANPSGRR